MMEYILAGLLGFCVVFLWLRIEKLKNQISSERQSQEHNNQLLQNTLAENTYLKASLQDINLSIDKKVEEYDERISRMVQKHDAENQSLIQMYERKLKIAEDDAVARVAAARKDAVKKSKAVTGGKIGEGFAPFTPEFNYNPRDCRFVGDPIDYIVFDGMNTGDVKHIRLVEVKTGSHADLTSRQREIRNCIANGNVKFETYRIEEKE